MFALHKARPLPARKLSRRNPPRRRRDGTFYLVLRTLFARAKNPFGCFSFFSILLDQRLSLVGKGEFEARRARARARRLFSPRFVERARERSRRVGGGSSIQSSDFFFVVVSVLTIITHVLSLFHISSKTNRSKVSKNLREIRRRIRVL